MVRCEVIDNQGKLRGTPSDEEGTLGDLKTFRQTLFDPTVRPSYDHRSTTAHGPNDVTVACGYRSVGPTTV